MSMPNHLFLVRHGESAGNIATMLSRQGDESHYTDKFVTTPGREWALTKKGRAQAAHIGAWLQRVLSEPELVDEKQRHYVSPYVRTKQTAGLLDLTELTSSGERVSVTWFLNRTLRERDWGDIETQPERRFRESYKLNAHKREIDPMYWRPPGGESVCDVAENRVRNFLDTLHRECSGETVIAVTHGEFIRATRVVLERISDETYLEWETDPQARIHNCEVIWYSRVMPLGFDPAQERRLGIPIITTANGANISRRISYLKRAYPHQTNTGWEIEASDWQRVLYPTITNADLLAK